MRAAQKARWQVKGVNRAALRTWFSAAGDLLDCPRGQDLQVPQLGKGAEALTFLATEMPTKSPRAGNQVGWPILA